MWKCAKTTLNYGNRLGLFHVAEVNLYDSD